MTTETAPVPPTAPTTHVVLVPGFWLGAWAWDDVVPGLRDAGLAPHPVTLPGLEGADVDRSTTTLEDHVRAVTDLVDGLGGDVVLVGHSGGAVVVQGVVDRRPRRVARAVYVDSGPMRPGVALDPAADGVEIPFPSDAELAEGGTSTDGLDADALAALRRRAVPHPAGVAAAPVDVGDPARLAVPVTVVCTSWPAELLQRLTASGQVPTELPDVVDVTYVDLPTGHWPMLSRPADLAAVLAEAARRR